MTFRDEEIREAITEQTPARWGWDPNRGFFTRKSRRPVPDFTKNDPQLRLVVAQTAFGCFRVGHHWVRVPDELVTNPAALRASLKARMRKYKKDDTLAKRYIEVLSSVAYLFWRVGYHPADIAEYIGVPHRTVLTMMTFLRGNAHRLGFQIPRRSNFRGEWILAIKRVDPALIHKHRSEATKRANARPEVQAKRSAGVEASWERRRATGKATWRWKRKRVVTPEFREQMRVAMLASWERRKAKVAA